MERINFYKVNDPYGCFSNFSRHPITLNGKVWPTTEHYFQAQKFAGTEHEENVRLCNGPSAAAAMGRDRNLPLRKDWEEVKEDIMMEALVAKVQQYAEVKALLLSTGTAELVEHTVNDSYWGDGGDGSGKNRLGHLLVDLRTKIKFDDALKELYHSWGVGEDDSYRARFWNSFEPNTNIYPFERFTREWTRVMELGWLSDTFPEEFPLC